VISPMCLSGNRSARFDVPETFRRRRQRLAIADANSQVPGPPRKNPPEQAPADRSISMT
jgi:hypothetical protein